jgi:phospholipid/cholesterol/gamma-HCH transport system substrate-binding protein
MNTRVAKIGLAAALVVILVAGITVLLGRTSGQGQTRVTGYFANSNGIFPGDAVWILGVQVGSIDSIEPQPERAKITFHFDDRYKVPANAIAAILSPSVVPVRALQLTPAYTGGPVMKNGALIPQERTAVPVEFDDLRQQLERLTKTLQPTEPGGVSTLGAFVNTAANNLRGEGANIRDTIIKLSQAFSALGDNSTDLFSTIKNLSILVSALSSSKDLLQQLNQNLASVTELLSNRPNEVGGAVADIYAAVGDVKSFVADNRETIGTTSDKLAALSQTLVESIGDIKQLLHVAPTGIANFENIYQPAQAAFTGALGINQFANPIQFLCSAVQAASRLGAEQSAKLCVQYLAPIIKNRQYNFPPLGQNLFVGASARPNEVTYSEDWLRPDYIPPPASPPGSPPPASGPLPPAGAPFTKFGEPADPYHGDPPFVPARPPDPIPTDPTGGLQGMMTPPPGGGS